VRPHGLPRTLRLRRESDFRALFRDGARARGKRLLVLAVPNGLPHSRLGVSVRRKLARRAVDRNRLKRILREAFRLRRADLPSGLDVVICPLVLPDDFPLREVQDEMVRLARSLAPSSPPSKR